MVDKKMYMAIKIPDDTRGKQNHILNKMIKNLGNTTWTLLFEEQGELIQAISKLKRFGKINKKTNYDNGFDVLEEVTDVYLESMIALKQLGYTEEDFQRMIQYKLNRLNKKINEGSMINK